MSLSFVKSAVLSSSDGISHNEEKTIDSKETQAARSRSSTAKPLFEQLKANQDADQEREDEFQKSLRGMRPLDEEDCAHLDAIQRGRLEKEDNVKKGIEREVAMFNAAKESRSLTLTVAEGDTSEPTAFAGREALTFQKKRTAPVVRPVFKVKRKRRDTETEPKAETTKNAEQSNTQSTRAAEDGSVGSSDDGGGGALGGLMCYGSDSE
mmetsp:Transcript_19110/g.44746  ORF Transcript_19110/g.44746 Transcript_19110/m.44746 type:complete len:209 (+) Transcript_19110:319-945(+)